jgi:Tol biopolymer transport system component
VEIEQGERVHGPQLLPDGRSVLFTLRGSGGTTAWQDAKLAVQSLDGGERRIIGGGRDGRYLATGHLVYGLQSALFAVPFDLATLQPRGAPAPLIEGLRQPTSFPGTTGTANYDVSATGTLVYVAGEDSAPVIRELVSVDRRGNVVPILADKRDYWRPRVSPDGRRIAVEIYHERGAEELWIVDAKAGTASALTSGATGVYAAWSPDGQSVIYRSNLQNTFGIYRHAIDGGGGPQLVHKTAEAAMPGQVSTDGTLVFAVGEQTGLRGIFTLSLSGPQAGGPPAEFLATPALEHMPMFSPDGRWVAYASNESGRSEVYMRAFPRRDESGRRVSLAGGTAPVWSRNGSELFYRDEKGTLLAVPIRLDDGLSFGRPEPLFNVTSRFRTSGNAAAYDVDAAGRFVMVTEPEVQPAFAREIGIVVNWHEELRRLAPAK